MRKKIVAGNWKMNTNLSEAVSLANEIVADKGNSKADYLVLIPPFVNMTSVAKEIEGTGIQLGAQNCSDRDAGAFTGEVSAPMIQATGARFVLVGHSERRAYFAENEELLRAKIDKVHANYLYPIYCCGETREQRESNSHFDIVKQQIEGGLFHLDDMGIQRTIVAYEPVWAIGTGLTASSDQAQEMHAFIRSLIAEKYGEDIASRVSILYGGSVKPDNAKELFSCADIDGGLIGGAALNAESFLSIASAF
jgi:triosephosphate isomerase